VLSLRILIKEAFETMIAVVRGAKESQGEEPVLF